MTADLVTLGETMGVFSAEEIGPLRSGHRMQLGIAGAESNVAIAVRRLGHSVAWIGRVGADPIGHLILRELRAEQVDVSAAIVDPAAPSGLMLKARRTMATSDVRYFRRGSAGSRLQPADVPSELVTGAEMLHLTGITPALSSTACAAVRHAIEIAQEAKVAISFDVNYRAALWSQGDATATLRDLVRACDVVFASENEAALLVDVDHDEPAAAAHALTDLGPRHAIVKRGELGYTACIDGVLFSAPAVSVPVADPVGAGDAFVAGYLASRLDGADPADALETANLTGAFVVAVPGDWEGSPTRADLHAFANRTDAVNR